MGEYYVSIDNEESNPVANNLSITGTVNGTSCAAVIRLSSLANLNAQDQKLAKQRALAAAYEKRSERKVHGAEKVTL